MRFKLRILRLRARLRLLHAHALSRAHTREGVSSCQTTVAIVPDGAQRCEDELAWDDRGRLPPGLLGSRPVPARPIRSAATQPALTRFRGLRLPGVGPLFIGKLESPRSSKLHLQRSVMLRQLPQIVIVL